MSATFSPGGRFGGAFTLLHPLGSGGMADVWLAWEEDLGREVALKILHRAAVAARENILAEAKSLAAARHPGVVPILRFGVDEATNHPFFAMPVYSGTLANRLDREGRLAETEVAELGMSLVPALAALHAAGIAHRDLKPSNVLLDEQGSPVLADIGPMGGGTPAWAAPEQLSGEESDSSFVIHHSSSVPVDGAAADWHALGLLLYRALVGTLPPPRGILPAAVEPPRGSLPLDLHPRPSRGWERLLVALLDPDPATRLSDPDAILRALLRLRRRCRQRAGLRRLPYPALFVLAASVAAVLLARTGRRSAHSTDEETDRPDEPARVLSEKGIPLVLPPSERGVAPQGPGGVLRVKPMTAENGDAPTTSGSEREQALLDAIGNVERPLARLQSLLDAAMTNPAPNADGIVHVPEGAVLFAEDIAGIPVSAIQLDGGTLLLAPPRQFLAHLAASWRESAETLRKTGDLDAPSAAAAMSAWRNAPQFIPCPILIGKRGGTLKRYDEWNDAMFCVTNAIRRAPGIEATTLHCDGFTGLVLNRKSLDPGLTITGSGSIADFLPDGRTRNRRWFDAEDPL